MYGAPVSEAPPVNRTAPYPPAGPAGPAGYGGAGYGTAGAGYGTAGYGAAPSGYTAAPGSGAPGAGTPVTGTRGGGTPGGGTSPRYGRRVAIIVGVALVIVAAGLAGGAFIAHHRKDLDAATGPSGSTTSPTKPAVKASSPQTSAPATAALPAGYTWYQQPSTETGTAAGFRLAVPQGWTASVSGVVTYFRGTTGGNFLEVDLSRQAFPTSLTEAHWLQGKTLSQGKFPGYQRYSLGPAQVDGSSGALWSFSWQEKGVGRIFVQDYLFRLSTSGGSQAYALYVSGPMADSQQDVQIADEAVQSFQPQN